MIALDADADARAGFVAVFADLLATVEGHLAPVTDDDVHDLRVAVRRTRSLLGHAKGIVPTGVRRAARATFRDLARGTNARRDLDVLAANWDTYAAGLDPATVAPVRAALDERRAAATTTPVVDAEGLAAWRDWLAADHPPTGRRLGDVVTRRIARARRVVLDAGRAVHEGSPAEAVHELRKDAKALRYLVDAFGPLLDKADRKRHLRALRDLQDVLGAHQDAAVHLDLLAELGAGPDLLAAARRRLDATRAAVLPAFAAYDS